MKIYNPQSAAFVRRALLLPMVIEARMGDTPIALVSIETSKVLPVGQYILANIIGLELIGMFGDGILAFNEWQKFQLPSRKESTGLKGPIYLILGHTQEEIGYITTRYSYDGMTANQIAQFFETGQDF